MAGLQRSAVSFRRQGSSGVIWDDRFLSGELKKKDEHDRQQLRTQQDIKLESEENNKNDVISNIKPISIDRTRSNGRGYSRAGKFSPNVEPPSPRLSACGLCSGGFGKTSKKKRRTRTGKRRYR
ncbi:hypothetical protein ACFE04_031548 [Oxalis oulophora]